MMLSQLPFIRAHKIRLRVWNGIPGDAGELYLRFEITDANNKVHMVKMYGNTEASRVPERRTVKPVWGKEVEGTPLPSGQWLVSPIAVGTAPAVSYSAHGVPVCTAPRGKGTPQRTG